MVQPENIDSGHSNFQLDTRSGGYYRNLDYLLVYLALRYAEPLVICSNCGNSKEPITASRACWLVGPFFANGSGLVGRSQQRSCSAMCDFSLHNVKSRPAKVGDKLTTHNFNTGTCRLAAPEDSTTAVCII